MSKQEAKQQIQKLVEKYQRAAEAGKVKSYNEAQTRNEFIEPFFECLGWDMRNLVTDSEVTTEEAVSGGRVDLAFRFNNIPVMFLEAKAMRVDLDEWKWAEQAINYSWNKSVTWAILTDFESVKIFNAEIPPKGVKDNLFFEIPWNEYLLRFEQLWLLSKESFENKLLDKEAQKWGKLVQRKQVSEKLFEDLMAWREALTREFKKLNNLTEEELDEGVQRILDRLIFIRTAEDRKIEPDVLMGLYRSWETAGRRHSLYEKMTELFRDFDNGYNSKLFAKHYCETWNADDKVFVEIIKGLYATKDGYRYDFSVISADVLGGMYEQYLSYVQSKSKNVEEKQKSKRKSSGVYYTPKYIVEYIVNETLGEVLKNTKAKDISKLKILDPACGSGSFLIAAYDKILASLDKRSLFSKFDILKDNIFGVDLDVQAVEIAQLNLLLKVLSQKTKLPTLMHNIRSGNSLISEGDEKYKPFNFITEFEEAFAEGGFDVIIGNPPYGAQLTKEEMEVFSKVYDIGSTDTAILFIKRAFDLLKDGGRMGFIVPKPLCFASNWEKIREYIGDSLEIIIDCGKAWKEVKLEQVVFVLHKGNKPKEYLSGKFDDGNLKTLGKISKKDAQDFSFFLNGVSTRELEVAKKIRANSAMLNDISQNQRGAMLQKFVSDDGDAKVIGGAQVQRFGIVGIKNKISTKKVQNKQAFIKNNSVLVQNIVAHIENPVDHIKITACIPQTTNSFILDTVNQITLEKDIQPVVIWCLLNSKLVNWYSYRFIFGKAIRTMHFDNAVTARLPIPKDIKNKSENLVRLGQDCIRLGSDLLSLSPNTDKYHSFKNRFEKLNQEIDQEVYKLYGLTEGEIGIIEK
ncbi:MAG: N-6 DNA methylase [Patescibacteria group bacterium]